MTPYYKRYNLFQIIKLFYLVCRTKIIFSKARIIRFPIDIRGKKYIRVSEGFTTGRYCRIEAYPSDNSNVIISFGKNVQINDFVHITGMKKVCIGNNVLLASKIYISDCSHGSYSGNINDSYPESFVVERTYMKNSVIIEDNVWIGESVSILPGVNIGKNSIIGANSVVTKSIPANCIAVGNPAKVVKKFNFQNMNWESVKSN